MFKIKDKNFLRSEYGDTFISEIYVISAP